MTKHNIQVDSTNGVGDAVDSRYLFPQPCTLPTRKKAPSMQADIQKLTGSSTTVVHVAQEVEIYASKGGGSSSKWIRQSLRGTPSASSSGEAVCILVDRERKGTYLQGYEKSQNDASGLRLVVEAELHMQPKLTLLSPDLLSLEIDEGISLGLKSTNAKTLETLKQQIESYAPKTGSAVISALDAPSLPSQMVIGATAASAPKISGVMTSASPRVPTPVTPLTAHATTGNAPLATSSASPNVPSVSSMSAGEKDKGAPKAGTGWFGSRFLRRGTDKGKEKTANEPKKELVIGGVVPGSFKHEGHIGASGTGFLDVQNLPPEVKVLFRELGLSEKEFQNDPGLSKAVTEILNGETHPSAGPEAGGQQKRHHKEHHHHRKKKQNAEEFPATAEPQPSGEAASTEVMTTRRVKSAPKPPSLFAAAAASGTPSQSPFSVGNAPASVISTESSFGLAEKRRSKAPPPVPAAATVLASASETARVTTPSPTHVHRPTPAVLPSGVMARNKGLGAVGAIGGRLPTPIQEEAEPEAEGGSEGAVSPPQQPPPLPVRGQGPDAQEAEQVPPPLPLRRRSASGSVHTGESVLPPSLPTRMGTSPSEAPPAPVRSMAGKAMVGAQASEWGSGTEAEAGADSAQAGRLSQGPPRGHAGLPKGDLLASIRGFHKDGLRHTGEAESSVEADAAAGKGGGRRSASAGPASGSAAPSDDLMDRLRALVLARRGAMSVQEGDGGSTESSDSEWSD
jgi:hypothetical protein